MPKLKHNNKENVGRNSLSGWLGVIQDAQQEILRSQNRIKRMEGVARTARRKLEAGEPFPIAAEDGATR
jgi:hypothetical protein